MATERPSAPRISVVIAVRNAASTIGRALDSVLDQDYPHVELVVIDGASTDATVAAIEERASRIAYWVSEPDSGVYDAWNKALGHVTGDWITFLGADDRYASGDVLTTIAAHLGSGNELRIVYGRVDVVDGEGRVVRSLGEEWQDVKARFREHMTIPHPATFHHRSLFEGFGQFDTSYRIAGDYEFLLRELLHRDACFVPDITAVRMGAGGLSDRPAMATLMIRETHRARYRHGLVRHPEWRSAAVYRSVIHAHISRRVGVRTADRVGDAYRWLTRSGSR